MYIEGERSTWNDILWGERAESQSERSRGTLGQQHPQSFYPVEKKKRGLGGREKMCPADQPVNDDHSCIRYVIKKK